MTTVITIMGAMILGAIMTITIMGAVMSTVTTGTTMGAVMTTIVSLASATNHT